MIELREKEKNRKWGRNYGKKKREAVDSGGL